MSPVPDSSSEAQARRRIVIGVAAVFTVTWLGIGHPAGFVLPMLAGLLATLAATYVRTAERDVADESIRHSDGPAGEARRGMRELEAYLGQHAAFAAYLDARDRTGAAPPASAHDDGQRPAAPRSPAG